MNKKELIDQAAAKCGLSKVDTKKVLDVITEIIKENLMKSEPVAIACFGTFHVKQRTGRIGTNPVTKAPIRIQTKKAAVFKPCSELNNFK